MSSRYMMAAHRAPHTAHRENRGLSGNREGALPCRARRLTNSPHIRGKNCANFDDDGSNGGGLSKNVGRCQNGRRRRLANGGGVGEMNAYSIALEDAFSGK